MESEKTNLNDNDTSFTIGAFIKPIKVTINNKEQYRWIVTFFEDQTFLDGNEINLYDYADSLEGLINNE